jgi:hypothetical protein
MEKKRTLFAKPPKFNWAKLLNPSNFPPPSLAKAVSKALSGESPHPKPSPSSPPDFGEFPTGNPFGGDLQKWADEGLRHAKRGLDDMEDELDRRLGSIPQQQNRKPSQTGKPKQNPTQHNEGSKMNKKYLRERFENIRENLFRAMPTCFSTPEDDPKEIDKLIRELKERKRSKGISTAEGKRIESALEELEKMRQGCCGCGPGFSAEPPRRPEWPEWPK